MGKKRCLCPEFWPLEEKENWREVSRSEGCFLFGGGLPFVWFRMKRLCIPVGRGRNRLRKRNKKEQRGPFPIEGNALGHTVYLFIYLLISPKLVGLYLLLCAKL